MIKRIASLMCLIVAFAATDLQAQINVELLELHHVGCAGLANGAIHVEVSGGSEPYNFSWSNGGQNAPYLGNLGGGFYFLTVTDAGGNSANKSYIVNEPTTLLAYFQDATIDAGGCSGTAELIIEGGSTPYTWEGASISTSTMYSNLCPGVEIRVIRDSAGCVSTASCRIATPTD